MDAFSVVLLSQCWDLFMEIYSEDHQGDIKYFSYLALGITLWNCIADSMALGSRFIIESATQILNTTYSLKIIIFKEILLYLSKSFYWFIFYSSCNPFR